MTRVPTASSVSPDDSGDRSAERARMVESQLVLRGIRDPRILSAFREVPREAFVPEVERAHAFDDGPLPIGCEQTISQPYVVAWMLDSLALGPDDVLLDVGTGSGYAAAVASRLVRRVVSVERIPELARRARERLAALGFDRVEVHEGDGSLGWPAEAPYDAIMVGAAAPEIPAPLVAQLREGGRLVCPVGPLGGTQELVLVTRRATEPPNVERLGAVRFVPLVGAAGHGG